MGAIQASTIPALSHAEAMRLAGTEYERYGELIAALTPDEWALPTACPEWDVRAMTAHVLGNCESCASPREAIRQMRDTKRVQEETGRSRLDAMTESQIRRRAHLSPAELVAAYHRSAPRAVKGRRRFPPFLRRLTVSSPPPMERLPLGWLMDVIYTRDVWMHRSDICRATGRVMDLTAEHDGRLVAHVVKEWAETHGKPFVLVLDGKAGGTYTQGEGGEEIHVDAEEFCRITSGRGSGVGLLAHQVLW